jgi:hypothetical protein
MKPSIIFRVVLALCAASACRQLTAQIVIPDGPDPRSRAKAYVQPTQVVLHVEHIEGRPLDPKYQSTVRDLRQQLDKATSDDERARLQRSLASAEREAERRQIKRFSGYMAVLGPGDGRFDDDTPHPKYYLVGSIEVDPKDQDLVSDVEVYDFLFMPDAIGGESEKGLSAFCKPGTGNSKPRVIKGAPRWWIERDIKFAPPWESPDGPTAISDVISGQLLPSSGKATSTTPPYSSEMMTPRVVRIQNLSNLEIDMARFVVRVLDQSGTEIYVAQRSMQSSTKLAVRQSGRSYRQHPELGKMAMEVNEYANGLVVERLSPGEKVEVQIAVPFNSQERAAKAEVFVTYVPSLAALQELQQSRKKPAEPETIVTIPVTGTKDTVSTFYKALKGEGIMVRNWSSNPEVGTDKFVVRITKSDLLTPVLVRRVAEACGVAISDEWSSQEI